MNSLLVLGKKKISSQEWFECFNLVYIKYKLEIGMEQCSPDEHFPNGNEQRNTKLKP